MGKLVDCHIQLICFIFTLTKKHKHPQKPQKNEKKISPLVKHSHYHWLYPSSYIDCNRIQRMFQDREFQHLTWDRPGLPAVLRPVSWSSSSTRRRRRRDFDLACHGGAQRRRAGLEIGNFMVSSASGHFGSRAVYGRILTY